MKMSRLLFDGHQKDPAPALSSPPLECLKGDVESHSIASSAALEPKPSELEGGEKRGFFSQPWTPRRIAIFSVLGFLGLVLIALVIALPIVLTRQNHDYPGIWKATKSDPNDPSYAVEDNSPVWAIHDFPDPGLIQHNGTWYAFGTNPKKNDPSTIHVPVATSTNFVNWTLHEGYDAMPNVGQWQKKVNTWAPDVIQRDDGKFVLYYAGESKEHAPHHCVGAAVSNGTDPMGPYTPLNESLACPHKYGGAIDPSPFRDADGKLYVVYKGDGNSVGSGGYCGNSKTPRKPVPIFLQEMKSDGITKIGDPVIILDINKTDGPLVEAPNIIRTDNGTYYLFFSSHCFTSLGYDVKYAHSTSIKGPYTRAERPLLQTYDFGLRAPGGATISPSGDRMVFHADCGGWRCMYAAAIDIRSHNNTIIMSSLTIESSGSKNSTGS
ncbi:Glycoside hydrolase family 43 [Penicillium odoratum]|uniref:Glycoside hydrolase family 43 n=1 Tax=Penicillium odoratum TaxID=1167516 RepID=UPI002548AFDD|nr:Glycoside hydrolase family 43 [Penicillium odoratum]KAJ5759922.1 Glycoside hydrolase family 43 [Penicillium odoratum]